MYTRRIFSPQDMLRWTRRDIALFLAIALLPVVLYDVVGLHWLHLPWLPIALVGTAVAFVLSFQNNASYDRAWEARKIWGGIVNTSRSLGILVQDFITNEFTDQAVEVEAIREIQKTMIFRHIGWLVALRHALRKPRSWEAYSHRDNNDQWKEWANIREFQVELSDELPEYLSEEDYAHVKGKTNVATHLVSLQSRQLRELRQRGLIDDFRHMEMQSTLVELYTLQGKSERIKNFPYPRQYATLNTVFLWIFIVLVPFGLLYEVDRLGDEMAATYPFIGAHFVWLTVPLSVIVMWVFHTTERIGRVTENPFEGSANDVPITSIARGIEIDLREMLDEDPATIPKPVPMTHNIQM